MKFAIIKERKNPPDRRVVFSPQALAILNNKYPEAEVVVEASDIRVFPDNDYKTLGFSVTEDITDADILFGVKEVPVEALIPNKKYFFLLDIADKYRVSTPRNYDQQNRWMKRETEKIQGLISQKKNSYSYGFAEAETEEEKELLIRKFIFQLFRINV